MRSARIADRMMRVNEGRRVGFQGGKAGGLASRVNGLQLLR